MANEQLRFELDIELAAAEKKLDSFFKRMERGLGNAANVNSLGGGLGGGGSRNSRQFDAHIKAQQKATRDAQKAQEKAARDREKQEREYNRIVERFENGRARRRQRLQSMSDSSDRRAEAANLRSDRFKNDDQAYRQATEAYQKFTQAKLRILQNASGKTISVIKAEMDLIERELKQAIAAASATATGNQNAELTKGKNRGKMLGGAFQVQQILEDMSFAGIRGATNNLAFLASQLANTKYAMLGFAGIAGVATVAVYDLASSFFNWANSADAAQEKITRLTDALRENAAVRGAAAKQRAEFDVPTTREQFQRQMNDLTRSERAFGDRSEARTLEKDINLLERLAEVRRLRDSLGNPSSRVGLNLDGSVGIDRPDPRDVIAMSRFNQDNALRLIEENLNSKLSTSGMGGSDPGAVAANLRKELEELQKGTRAEGDRLKNQREMLENSQNLVPVLERIAELEDKITDKLSEQISEEQRLVEETKRRAEAIRDAEYSRRDAFGSKMLDAQSGYIERYYDKRVEAVTNADRRIQEGLFNARFGNKAGMFRPMFDKWMEARAEAIKRAGERATERDQRNLATQRARMLRDRANNELNTAKGFASRGDVENANRYFDRARDSLGQLQDMQLDWSGKATSLADQQAFLREAQQTEKSMQNVALEAERAAEAMQKIHDDRLKRLMGDLTEQVKLLKLEAVDLEIIKPEEVDKATILEAKLKSILELLEKGDLQGGLGGGAAGGGGLFSVPMPNADGSQPAGLDGLFGGRGGGNPANRDAAGVFTRRNVRTRQQHLEEAVSRRQDQVKQAQTRREQAREEGQERFRNRFAKLKERLRDEREERAQGRADVRQRQKDRSGRLGAAGAREPMKGTWNPPKPDVNDPNAPLTHRDPLARAKGYLPLLREMLERREKELMEHPNSQHNLTTRMRKLYPLWQEKGRLEKELESEPYGSRRTEDIGNRLQEMLKEVSDFDAERPLKKAAERAPDPIWRRRDRNGNWTSGEGLLAPSTMAPSAGVSTSRSLNDFKASKPNPASVTNSYVSHVTVGSVVTQNMDANKFTADLAAQSKANFRRMGVTK